MSVASTGSRSASTLAAAGYERAGLGATVSGTPAGYCGRPGRHPAWLEYGGLVDPARSGWNGEAPLRCDVPLERG